MTGYADDLRIVSLCSAEYDDTDIFLSGKTVAIIVVQENIQTSHNELANVRYGLIPYLHAALYSFGGHYITLLE